MPKIGHRTTTSSQESQPVVEVVKPDLPVPDLGKIPPSGSPWQKKEVKVKREYDGGTVSVDRCIVWAYGPIAVWPDSNDECQWWEVMHIPTMAACIYLYGEDRRDDAMKIGEVLVAKCGSCLREETIEEIRENRPKWAIEWIKRCKEANKYVDP